MNTSYRSIRKRQFPYFTDEETKTETVSFLPRLITERICRGKGVTSQLTNSRASIRGASAAPQSPYSFHLLTLPQASWMMVRTPLKQSLVTGTAFKNATCAMCEGE